jgi:hypothetical protein
MPVTPHIRPRRTLKRLQAVVNADAWDWLQDKAPRYAVELQAEIADGATADDVRQLAGQIDDPTLARKVEQAAGHLLGQKETQ